MAICSSITFFDPSSTTSSKSLGGSLAYPVRPKGTETWTGAGIHHVSQGKYEPGPAPSMVLSQELGRAQKEMAALKAELKEQRKQIKAGEHHPELIGLLQNQIERLTPQLERMERIHSDRKKLSDLHLEMTLAKQEDASSSLYPDNVNQEKPKRNGAKVARLERHIALLKPRVEKAELEWLLEYQQEKRLKAETRGKGSLNTQA